MEVDAPRCDSRGFVGSVLIDSGERRHRHAVRIVRVDDVGPELLEDAREPPRGGEIHLRARRQRKEVQPFVGAAAQLPARMGDERGAMSERAQAQHRHEHLVLTAPPGARGIDVE